MHGKTLIYTLGGKSVDPFNLKAEDIDIKTIAHALAYQCRFGGHTRHFWSVAQHSICVAYMLPKEFQLAGLLHDAAEAYVGDIIRPIKERLLVHDAHGDPRRNPIAEYEQLERRTLAAILSRFGVDTVLPPEVIRADNAMLYQEISWLISEEEEHDAKECLGPEEAERVFLKHFCLLTTEEQRDGKAA